jgi:hypothetical protein
MFLSHSTHRNNGGEDLGHIVKVSDDTFAKSEIIPVLGIIYVFLVLYLLFKTSVNYCGKKHRDLSPTDYFSSYHNSIAFD